MKISTLFKNISSVKYTFHNETDIEFNLLTSVFEASHGDISWIRPGIKNLEAILGKTKASCLICNPATYNLAVSLNINCFFVVTENPEIVFLEILKTIYQHKNKRTEAFIHPTAIISKNCKLGKNISIGAFSIIDNAIIGDNCIISNNVCISSDVEIGNNCIIREFCSIGGEGFGFIKNIEGHLEHMPHIGKVIIEDNVHIFPFSNIDKATLTETKISKGVKIDHYCHIGHNCFIGENTIVAASVVTCGGVTIGSNCFIGVNTIVKPKVTIADGVTTGLGSVVTKNIPLNETWAGSPAREFSAFIKK